MMATGRKYRFPVIASLFYGTLTIWAVSKGYKKIADWAGSMNPNTADGGSAPADPPADDEEHEGKGRAKNLFIWLFLGAVAVAAGVLAAYLFVSYAAYLFANAGPGATLGIIGAKVLIFAVFRSVHKHTKIPLLVCLAMAVGLSSAIFGIVTTHINGRSLVCSAIGVDWNWVLLLGCVALWIVAIVHSLYMKKALGTVTAASVALALLLLAYPIADYCYTNIHWVDPVVLASRLIGDAEAKIFPDQGSAVPQALGYWVEKDGTGQSKGTVVVKLPYTETDADGAASMELAAASLGDIYITEPGGAVAACWPYGTPDNPSGGVPQTALDLGYFSTWDDVAIVRLTIWDTDGIAAGTLHIGDEEIPMDNLPVIMVGG